MSTLAENQEISLTIQSLSHGGNGVGRHDSFVVFVPFTAPEDRVRVRIISIKKNYAQAELLNVESASPHRISPPCPVFQVCGGCQWQHVRYEEQLRQKQMIVEHALSRIAKEAQVPISPIIASARELHYRNRAQFRTQGPRVGFYQKQSHELVDVEKCFILEEPLNEELGRIKKECQEYDSFKTSKIEVALGRDGTVRRSTNKGHGEALGFSQVNSCQNTGMVEYVCELLGAPSDVARDNVDHRGNLIDLYCGNGNFSLALNRRGWRIYGIDGNRRAIQTARSLGNKDTFFSFDDCSRGLGKLVEKKRKFEAIVLDPPRIGTDEALIGQIAAVGAHSLVYISCDPATFARDWARIKNKTDFQLVRIQPFDMFPQTFHTELVAYAAI